jgi:hypothetical protein
MAGKTQYWLITIQQEHCSGYYTFAIAHHPANYMAKHIEDTLFFAMPITKQQFKAVDKACSG